MGPHGSHRAARAGAAAAGARRGRAGVRERVPAPPGGGRRRRPRRRGALPRGPGRVRAGGLARRRPDGGAGLQPHPRRARLRAGRLGARDQHRGPAVPRRLGERRAAGPRPGHRARAAPDRRHRALARTAASRGSCTPAERPRPSRSCTSSSTGAWRPRTSPTSRTPCARCWPTCAASCATSPPCASASTTSIDVAREGAAALRRRRGRRGRRLPAMAGAPTTSSSSAPATTSCATARCASSPGSGLGLLDDEARSAFAKPVAVEDARAQAARARAGGRAAAGLQDEPAVAGAPPRAHGLRRHPPGLGRRRDRRRGAHDRALHDQGLRRAGLRDAGAAPQAAAGPRQRGPDRGLARLQGRRHALRLLPQGRAVRRADRRPAPARSSRCWGCRPRRAACSAAATPTGAPRRSSSRCPRAATTRRCSSACARSCAGASTPARSTPTRSSARATACACTSPSTAPRAACPSSRAATSRPRSSSSRARGTTAPATSSWRATATSAAACWPSAGPGACPTPTRPPSTRPRRPTTSRRFERLFTGGEAFHVGLRNEPDGLTRIGMYRVGDKVELSQAMPTLEHLGLRVIEERPTRLLGGDGALWLQDFGVLGPTDLPLDLEECGERVAQSHRGRLARRGRVGLAEPAGHQRRPGLAAGRDPARLPQVPPAHRLALHRGLPERRDRGQPAHHREAHPPLRAALRPRDRARRGGRGRAARRDPRRPRGRALARPRPHPAQPARAHRGDAAHQRLPLRAALDRLQAALGRRARDPAAAAAVRDLRLRARGRGHPPARRQDRARRPALVGPHGLPHRGLRPHARADDQERGHRARRRQGRLLPAPAPRRPGRAEGRGRAPVRDLRQRPARPHRQPRRRRGRASRRRARARRRRHLPGRRGRQGHGDVLGHRQPRRRALRLLARRRVRLRRLDGLRPQGARDHRARRVGVGQAPLPRARPRPRGRRVHRRRASATCPATCSATGCC